MNDAKPSKGHSSGGEPKPVATAVKYRFEGTAGAIRLAVQLVLLIATVAAGAGGTVLLLGGNAVIPQLVLALCLRMSVLGACVAVASAIAMAINNGRREQLLFSHHAGESGALLGVIAALLSLSAIGIPNSNSPMDGQSAAKNESARSVVSLSGETIDGRMFDLSEMRGKVVLVDFWATWCGPCVAALPDVHSIYDAYHKDGLEIVGVSLDFEKPELEDYVAAKNIPWLQLIPSKKKERGWSHPLVTKFGVDGIPRMLLIGKDGKMISDDIYPHELDAAVSQALGVSAGRAGGAGAAGATGPQSGSLLRRTIGGLLFVLVRGALWLVAPAIVLGGILGAAVERVMRGGPHKSVAPVAPTVT